MLGPALHTLLSMFSSTSSLSLLFCATVFYFYQKLYRSPFPIINAYPWDLTKRKACRAYMQNAAVLVTEGFAKYHGPFQIYTPNGYRLILPSSFTDWAKGCKDLDHQQLVHQDFFAGYSGFEGQKFVTNPDRILIDVVRLKLSQNSQSLKTMDAELQFTLEKMWSDCHEWHRLEWQGDTMEIISRMSASVFVGTELARNEEWQKITTTYTVNVFTAVATLRKWPSFLRPIVHLFLPESTKCRKQVQFARKMMHTILENRARGKDISISQGQCPEEFNDCITWMEEVAVGRPFDPTAAQLALAISALHTTSEAFRQVLLDLCVRQDLIQLVRDEIETVSSEMGLSLAALAKMELLDSVLKESQRLTSASVGIERKVIRDTVLPNGQKVPKGTNIAINSADMWSSDVHSDPQTFDGFRFLRIRRAGGKRASTAAFVSSSKEQNTFGAGKFICPGRFFVANEMKIALVHILLKYDIRLRNPEKVQYHRSGFYGMTDLQAIVEVRRRRE